VVWAVSESELPALEHLELWLGVRKEYGGSTDPQGKGRLSMRPAQEVDDQVRRRLRLLFRDPVPAIRDDRIFDVVGDTP
jgi:hypothetical protein